MDHDRIILRTVIGRFYILSRLINPDICTLQKAKDPTINPFAHGKLKNICIRPAEIFDDPSRCLDMHHLPPEILHQILSYLLIQELFITIGINRWYYRECLLDPQDDQ